MISFKRWNGQYYVARI